MVCLGYAVNLLYRMSLLYDKACCCYILWQAVGAFESEKGVGLGLKVFSFIDFWDQ